MRSRPYQPLLDLLYGDPGKVVPWINVALGVGVGLVTRSPGAGLATTLVASQVWNRMSPRMVIEDLRLGAMTLTCPPAGRQVWLTFDDGPGPETDAVLDLLQRYEASATFFFIGENVSRYADLDRLRERLQAGGHRVGNHSWSHPNFLRLGRDAAEFEVDNSQRLLDETFPDSVMPMFRPPFGYRTEGLFTHLKAVGLAMIGWSVNSLDFLNGPAQSVTSRVLRLTRPGSILLFHDGPFGRQRTLEALPEILSGLESDGYVFSVPQLEELC